MKVPWSKPDIGEEEKDAVVTADHGEVVGEWGMYTHTLAMPECEFLRVVPWFEV